MAPDARPHRGAAWAALLVALALSLASAGLPAAQPPQQPPPPPPAQDPQRPPPIRTGAELVRVDVAVIDGKGLPVPSLTSTDFEVLEDDVPQTIQSFRFVSVDGHPEAGDDVSLPIRSREHAAAEAARDDVRVFLIFWDEYHINRLTSAVGAREHLMRFVKTAFGPKDLVAFMDPLTPIEAIRFTRDRHELAETIRTLQGRSGVYTPVRSILEEAHMYSREGVERIRSQVTMTALKSAAVHLGTLRQGRKAIVLISEGMRGLGRDEAAMMGDVIQAANDSNTGIFTMNPEGLTLRRAPRFDMLQALANNTGGESFMTNDLERALRRVVTQSSAYYLLGYSPGQRALDGKFRRIRVRVKRPGLEVRARAGYWAPTISDMERAKRLAADALPPAVAQALAELKPAASHHSADLWVGLGVSAAGRPQVRVVWAPRDLDDPANGRKLEPAMAAVVATSDGEEIFAGDVGPEGVAFDATPGPLKIVADVKNAAGEIVDRHTRTITVPDPAAPEPWISSPVILRTSSPLEFRRARTESTYTPAAAREFERSDRLLIQFAVHGAGAADAPITARLLNGRNELLTTLTVARQPDTRGHEIDLPLSTIARGDYLIRLEARTGAGRAETYLPLRILR